MYDKYFITGGTGFLGHWIVKYLVEAGAEVHALVLPGDKNEYLLPPEVFVRYGSVTDRISVEQWLSSAGENSCLIHCAGIVSIETKASALMEQVNVQGTKTVLNLCIHRQIGKFVYVSSVHAFPDKTDGNVQTERSQFDYRAAAGHYGRSKAKATELVLNGKNRLNITVVHPSGLIGPEDYCNGSMTQMIKLYLKRKLPAGVKGGYDFSDVRDVAHGVIKASEYEKSGECFILSGHYKTIKDLFSEIDQNTGSFRSLPCVPLSMARAAAPVFEAASLRRKEKPYFTPYSIHVLGSNGLFSHEKAAELLGYTVRPVSETIRDTVEFLLAHEKIQMKKRKGMVKPVLKKSLC